VNLLDRQAQHGGGVGGVVQGDPIGATSCQGSHAELGAPARGALGTQKPGVGPGVPARQNLGQVGLGHFATKAQGGGAATPPASGLLAAIRVVVRRTLPGFLRIGHARCPTLSGTGLEVAHDRVDDLGYRSAGAAQRGDAEPHRCRLTRGRSAGFPEGNLQGCARWICRWGTTVGTRGG